MTKQFRRAGALTRTATFAALALFGLGTAGIAHAAPEGAAPQGAAPPQQSQPGAAEEVTDAQLEQFVDAATEVQTVQQEYAAEIQATQEQAEAQSLRQEAQEKMVEAVEGSGLSVSEYNLIAQRLQQDQSLVERLNQIQE